MSDTVRERILQAARAALEAASAPAPTYRTRLDVLPEAKLPAFCLAVKSEKLGEGQGDETERIIALSVVCAVGNSSMQEEAAIDQLADPLTAWVEQQLVGNQFGGLASDTTYTGSEWMNVAGEIDLVGVELSFEVKYWTLSGDPAQSAS
jgi:hypothetical protein